MCLSSREGSCFDRAGRGGYTLARPGWRCFDDQAARRACTEWRGFFDRLSKAALGKRADIEVASLDLGDQVIAEWMPLVGITYDSGDDLLDVALDGGTNHLIRHPRDIVVEEDAGSIRSVTVVDGEGTRQVVKLREPLTLPSVQGP